MAYMDDFISEEHSKQDNAVWYGKNQFKESNIIRDDWSFMSCKFLYVMLNVGIVISQLNMEMNLKGWNEDNESKPMLFWKRNLPCFVTCQNGITILLRVQTDFNNKNLYSF